jgi:peptidoglycan hydrolase-like protein with peptidoglycan-binding domain
MSQAEDLTAINDYFNRTAGKTPAAKTMKESWTAWYNSLSTWQKTMTDSVLLEAKSRRTAFNAANLTPEDPTTSERTMTPAEKAYWVNYPTVDTTGMTADEAQKAIWTPKKGLEEYTGAVNKPTLRVGSKGEAVKQWQTILGLAPDGIFGQGTYAATKVWQGKHAIKADGVVGMATWTAAAAGTSTPDTSGGILTGLKNLITPPSGPVKLTRHALGYIPPTVIKSMQPTGKVTPPPSAAPSTAPTAPVVQTASMIPAAFAKLPTWAKAVLGIFTVGGLAYGMKYSAEHRRNYR